MIDLGKELERAQDEAGTAVATLTSAKAEVHRLTSKLGGVRERSEGSDTNWRASTDKAEAAAGREREKSKRLRNSLGGAEVQREGLIRNLEELRGILEAFKGK